MPRIARMYSELKVYHIIIRGIDKQDIFLDTYDKDKFLKIIRDTKEKYNYEVYAYCLMDNHVHLIIYDKYDGFGNLKSLQVMGKAQIIEPFSDIYNAHAEYKKIPLAALKKLESPMNLICVTPVKIEALFSNFKKNGYTSRQTLHF